MKKEFEKAEIIDAEVGYKIFNSNWECKENGIPKQYTCPGKFKKEDDNYCISFYRDLRECVKDIHFTKECKIAKVLAIGSIYFNGVFGYTDELIVMHELEIETLNDDYGYCSLLDNVCKQRYKFKN